MTQIDPTTGAIILNTVANTVSCAAIVVGAYYLGQRHNNPTARHVSRMLYSVGVEITLSTVALYFLDSLWVWIGLRLAGRGIEFVGVVSFLRYLTQEQQQGQRG